MEEFLNKIKEKNKKRTDNNDVRSIDKILEDNNTPNKEQNIQRKKNNRQTYFCIGFSDVWQRNPIHITLKNCETKSTSNG